MNSFATATEPSHPASPDEHFLARQMLTLALVWQMGLLPMLWNDANFVSSMVWTAIGGVLMTAAVLMDKMSGLVDRELTLSTLAFLIIYPLFCTFSWLLTEGNDPERGPLLLSNAVLMVLAALYFLFGATAARRASTPAIAAAILIAGTYAVLARDSFTIQAIYDRMQSDGIKVDYQYLGDVFVMSSAMLLPRLRSTLTRLMFLAAAMGIMFLVPSRSAAFLGAASLILTAILASNGRFRTIMLTLLVTAVLAYHALPLEQIFEGTRFESIVSGSDDTSIDLREDIFAQGEHVIATHPLIGNWAFQIDAFGNPGLYVHNALDIWAQAGIIPLLIFLGVWAIACRKLVELWRLDMQAALSCLPLLLFAALSWIVSRSINYVLPFFCLGYLAGLLGTRVHELEIDGSAAAPEPAIAVKRIA